MTDRLAGDVPDRGGLRKPRVLIVEDDPALTQMLRWELEDRGMCLLLAGSFSSALATADSGPFDLAVVDADLPDGDGVILAEVLAREHPEAVVALCSGRHGLSGDMRRPPAVHAVLPKPVSVRCLLTLLGSG